MTAIPDFNAGGYRFEDLLHERIVSSRGDLNFKQTRLGFPRPIKTGLRAAWFPKSEVHAGSPSARRCVTARQHPQSPEGDEDSLKQNAAR